MIEKKSYEFTVNDIKVEFPHETPYVAQRGMIAKSLKAYTHFENALLESPTGTGKSLALLAGALSYQKYIGTHPILPPTKRDPYKHHLQELSDVPIEVNPDEELYKCNVPLERRNVPIWYTTRTHSQLKQLVGELKKLPYHPQLAILASRKKICLFPKVRDSNDPDGACRRAVEKEKCPFSRKKGIPPELLPRGRLGKFDIEEFLDYCKPRMICPYFKSREMMKYADLVLATYNLVLNPKVKGQMMLSILGVVLIVDEAHNVEATIRECTSYRHARGDIMIVLGYLNGLIKKAAGTELEYHLTVLRDVYSKYINYIHERGIEMRDKGISEWVEKNNDNFFEALGLNKSNWFDFRVSMDHSFVAYNGGVNKDTKEKVGMPLMVAHLGEELYVVLSLCFKDHMKYKDGYKFVLQTGITEEEDVFMALNVNPGAYFSTVADEVNSVVLSSGTLNPIHQLSVELGTSFQNALCAPHVIDPEQLIAFTVKESMDGVKLTSAYSYLKDERIKVESALGKLLLKLLPVIPGGALFFVPSHDFMDSMLNTWDREGLMSKLDKIKPFFRERREPSNEVYAEYKSAIEEYGGAFLVGVYRGKMSEGIDFYDDQSRAVFAFGIPYSPPNELENRLKREYNDSKCAGLSDEERGMNGTEWYNAQAFRALFQATGRCIRHANDYGAVILIDSRFAKHEAQFPRWMKGSFQCDIPINDIESQLKVFYDKMAAKFPTKHSMRAGQPLSLFCSNCEGSVTDIAQLNEIECFTVGTRPGVQELLGCDPERPVVFLRKKQHTGVQDGCSESDVAWCEPECSGYSVITCHCGEVVGAVLTVGKFEETDMLDGMWLLTQKITAVQNGHCESLDALIAPKPNIRMKMEGKGQKVIVCVEE